MTKQHHRFVQVAIIALLVLMFVRQVARGQWEPSVNTGFQLACYVATDFDTVQVHILMGADGEDLFVVGQEPAEGRQPLRASLPELLVVTPGYVDIGYVTIEALDTPYTHTVTFTQSATGKVLRLPIRMWELVNCSDPSYVPPFDPILPGMQPPIPPDAVYDGSECRNVATDSSTGLPYCYDAQHGGVIPIPPPLNQQ